MPIHLQSLVASEWGGVCLSWDQYVPKMTADAHGQRREGLYGRFPAVVLALAPQESEADLLHHEELDKKPRRHDMPCLGKLETSRSSLFQWLSRLKTVPTDSAFRENMCVYVCLFACVRCRPVLTAMSPSLFRSPTFVFLCLFRVVVAQEHTTRTALRDGQGELQSSGRTVRSGSTHPG